MNWCNINSFQVLRMLVVLSFFLWTGVISTCFRLWGYSLFSFDSLNSSCKTIAETVEDFFKYSRRNTVISCCLFRVNVNLFLNITYPNYFEWNIVAIFKELTIAFGMGSVKSYEFVLVIKIFSLIFNVDTASLKLHSIPLQSDYCLAIIHHFQEV